MVRLRYGRGGETHEDGSETIHLFDAEWKPVWSGTLPEAIALQEQLAGAIAEAYHSQYVLGDLAQRAQRRAELG